MNEGKLSAVCRSMLDIFSRNHIPRAAAALSYFLTLSIFPLLICLYTMLGSMFPAAEQIRNFLSGLLPYETVDAIVDYLAYISNNLSTAMSVAALLVLLTSSSAAFRVIDKITGEMRGRRRFTDFFALLFSFVFSVFFLFAIFLAVILIVTGKWFLDFVDRHIMFLNISDSWSWARFLLLFLLLFVILSGVYRITAPHGGRTRLFPGAIGASFALVIVSIVFSGFVGASARYPLVYGSLASIVIMMLWLYICGIILLMGSALNVAIEQME